MVGHPLLPHARILTLFLSPQGMIGDYLLEDLLHQGMIRYFEMMRCWSIIGYHLLQDDQIILLNIRSSTLGEGNVCIRAYLERENMH